MDVIDQLGSLRTGKLSRRAFNKSLLAVGLVPLMMPLLPRRALAAPQDQATFFTWGGYDIPDYFDEYVAKRGELPNFVTYVDATVHRKHQPEIDVVGLGRMALNGHDAGRPDGARALVAIRPENLIVQTVMPTDGRPGVAGTVKARQYLGGRQVLHIDLIGRSAPVAVTSQGGQDEASWDLAPGHAVWITWNHNAIIVLDHD